MKLFKYSQITFDKGKNSISIILWWFVQATIFRCSFHNMYLYRACILRLFGCKVGKGVKIRASAKFYYPWKISIGEYSWIGDGAILYSLDNIEIGDNCVISQYAHLCTGSHDVESESFKLITKPIIVKDAVWIATDVFVGQGVTLREGSVIGARSSIYKDTEAWIIYLGNPAIPVSKRDITRE